MLHDWRFGGGKPCKMIERGTGREIEMVWYDDEKGVGEAVVRRANGEPVFVIEKGGLQSLKLRKVTKDQIIILWIESGET